MSRILATLSFFTRLPFYRLASLSKADYERVVPLWPLAGWLTGFTMMLVFCLASFVFPVAVSVIFALAVRLLLTGALHEDGFADFFDGFGGGHDRSSILRIMKDSHIGTYGVLALVVYFALLITVLSAVFSTLQFSDPSGCFSLDEASPWTNLRISLVFLCADTFAKWASSNIINILPYARAEQEAKNKLVYSRMAPSERVIGFLLGILPSLLTIVLLPEIGAKMIFPLFASALAAAFVIFLCHRKIKAYTGDCCGACFIISELVFFVVLLAVL